MGDITAAMSKCYTVDGHALMLVNVFEGDSRFEHNSNSACRYFVITSVIKKT